VVRWKVNRNPTDPNRLSTIHYKYFLNDKYFHSIYVSSQKSTRNSPETSFITYKIPLHEISDRKVFLFHLIVKKNQYPRTQDKEN